MFRRNPPIRQQPTWLIVGLGNPGAEYKGTRHNVGFEVVEAISKHARIPLARGEGRAQIGIGSIQNHVVALIKPLTFMNLSGQAVLAAARKHGVPADHILVIADDLDLSTGVMRMKLEGGAGGHNGHKSIIQSLGTQAYPRLRIGIGRSDEPTDHVLGHFHPDEYSVISDAIKVAAQACEHVITGSWTRAMELVTQHNKLLNASED